MTKDNTLKTVLIVGGVGLGVYFLAKQGIGQQIKDALSGIVSNIGGGGGGFPNINIALPQLQTPTLPDLASLCEGGACLPSLNIPSAGIGGLQDLIDNVNNAINPPSQSTGTPSGHASLLDVVSSMPWWAKGVIGVSAGALGGYGGYQLIRVSAPVLKALGTQAAKAVSGAGDLIASLLGRTAETTITGVTKSIPSSIVPRAGVLGGLLPAIAFTGIIEGAYNIYRTMIGAKVVGMTGVPPLDLVNIIRGIFNPGQAPTLLIPNFGVAAAAQGGSPATVAPTYAPQLAYSGTPLEQFRISKGFGGGGGGGGGGGKVVGTPASAEVPIPLPTAEQAVTIGFMG